MSAAVIALSLFGKLDLGTLECSIARVAAELLAPRLLRASDFLDEVRSG